jgi:hypothetical protein
MNAQHKIPIWFKIVFIVFMAVYLPAYWIGYGPQNFLWLSSVILILCFLATLLESPFLASMAAVGGTISESIWTIDFLITLLTPLDGFTIYVFDPNTSLILRIIAVFHIFLPPFLIWLVFRLGYHTKAWIAQTALTWALLLFTWFFTSPILNINLVFSYLKYPHLNMGAVSFLLLVILSATVMIGATHLLFQTLTHRHPRV